MSELNWYVVHTYSGYENKVKANIEKTIENRKLQDQIFEVRVPLQDVVEMKGGVKKNVSKKMFPGYVLVNMVMNDDTWYVVRNTRGVTGFVGPGSKPVPLTEEEMLPAAGQGILAVQGRTGVDYAFLDGYCDADAWSAGCAERAFVRCLNGGCSSPVAAFGTVEGEMLFLRGLYYNEETGNWFKDSILGNRKDAEELGITLAEQMKESDRTKQDKGEAE
mgnify:CR=1 FL=1